MILKIEVFIIGFFIFGVLLSCREQPPLSSPGTEILQTLKENADKELSDDDKIKILVRADSILQTLKNDTLVKDISLELSLRYYKLEDSLNFYKYNSQAFKLSKKLKDSSGIAATFWDKGFYYKNTHKKDSAYYYFSKAQKIYAKLNRDFSSARMFIEMAGLEMDARDFTGAEAHLVETISYLRLSKRNDYLWQVYNNLGIVNEDLNNFEQSLFYYKKAEEFVEKREVKDILPIIWNNIGSLQLKNENYEEAAKFFKKALNFNKNLLNSDPELFAILLDNQGKNHLLLEDTLNVKSDFERAMVIKKQHSRRSRLTVTHLNLAKYYLFKGDTVSSVNQAKESLRIARETQVFTEVLEALQFLVKVDKPGALQHSQAYMYFSDSLQTAERQARNKLARIRFETDEHQAQAVVLKERFNWAIFISLMVVGALALLFVIFRQKAKNQQLQLSKARQDAENELYKMSLNLQDRYDQGRQEERTRMARHLHDGVVSDLFGVRLGLERLDKKEDKEAREKRKEYLDKIQQISEDVRELSHQLQPNHNFKNDFISMVASFLKTMETNELGIHFSYNKNIDFEDLAPELKVHLFRIIQEGIQNIHKHAEANSAEVMIDSKGKTIILRIADNGVGLKKRHGKEGLGLKNIQERVGLMKGKLRIEDLSPQSGTEIIVLFPAKKPYYAKDERREKEFIDGR